jgi:hypothetical protein
MNDSMLSPQSLSIEPPRRDRITAISTTAQRRPIVLVLGMHRSGTSLCSHLLSALGIDMVDEIRADSWNVRGHWERWEIVEFHDRILRLFNRDYWGRFHDFALPVAWWADPRVVEIRREIVGFLEQRMGDAHFGFKDPRTVRLMPMWHQIFNELKLAPRLVLCLRNPAEVARSLHSRDGLDLANGEYRWLVHMIDFYRYTSNFEVSTVEYEGWFTDPAANIEKLRKFLDLPWQQSEADLALMLSGIIDPVARHDDPAHREANQPLVRSLYKLASRAGQDAGARDEIAYIVSQFVSFQQLQRPFLQVFEEVATTAAKYPAIEQEASALRASVSERDAAVEAADARAAGAEAHLAETLLEIEHKRGQIAELAGERDEASRLNAALAERETALAYLSRRADELQAALQAAQAEVAAREAALNHAEREVQESGAVAEATRSENAALQDALALTERGGQERAIAAEALQAELATLRGTVAQAEREAQERAAAAAALEAEIVGLQGTLTAARQVGKAAIAAFRIETKAPAKLAGPPGWRQAVMRLMRREPSVIISRANRARDAGQWDFAAQLYRKALDRNPRNSPIWVQYGHVLKESGGLREPDKLAQAEIAYRRALALDSVVADSHLQLGHVLKLQGKIHEAEACYLRALARDPSMPDPLRELSGLDWSEAQLSELRSCAVMSFSDRAELPPNNERRSGPVRRPQMSE